MITAKSKISDCVLEPDDQTVLTVSLTNENSKATAENVCANLMLKSGPQQGIILQPSDRHFGNIGPNKCVSKTFVIDTKCAEPCRKHEVCIALSYDLAMPSHECEVVAFEVGKD